MQNLNSTQMSVIDNMKKIQALVNAGKIDTKVGTALLNQMLIDSLNKNSQSGANFPPNLNQQQNQSPQQNVDMLQNVQTQTQQTPLNIVELLKQFEASNTDFFKKPSRQSVKEYLQNNIDEMTPSHSKLVTTIETGAVDDYVNQMNHQKQLENANKEAISKMNTNVANTSNLSNNLLNKVFTREDVKKMSTDEFLANEAQIMAQLREEMKNRKK
ncbi:MAG: hypothetical protein BHW64_03085 [Candidatus Melainabacteria bacterium LEY3_CP_29_8]|nr:MAG: hypothetical protein BHW64_03085 [Candidatus Melainabacteria bacterium LEY3_CP_29_8]